MKWSALRPILGFSTGKGFLGLIKDGKVSGLG